MQSLINYLLKNRVRTVLAAMLFTLLPFFGWLGIVLMSLVTLKKGFKQGFYVLVWIALPGLALAVSGNYAAIVYSLLGGCVLSWLLAGILRETKSWTLVIEVAALFAIVAIVLLHACVNDVPALWQQHIGTQMQEINAAVHLPNQTTENLTVLFNHFSRMLSGAQAAFVLLAALVNLLLARLWQTKTVRANTLKKELYQISVGWVTIGLFLAVLLGVLANIDLAYDLIFVAALPFVCAGVSITHKYLVQRVSFRFAVLAFYLLLVMFFPYVSILLVICAIADKFFNFRRHLTA